MNRLQPFSNHRPQAHFFAILLSCLFIIFSACSQPPPKAQYRFIYNNDGTEILGNRWHQGRPLTIDDVHSYVDIVAETPVTTFMICSGSMLSYYKSQYERPLGVLAEDQQRDEANEPNLNENILLYERNYRLLQEQGTDIIALCVNRAKEKGMEAFITMRMNDLHFADPELHDPRVQSDFWLQHPEWRMGDYPGWHADGALNFAHEGVRAYRLNLIREQCELYDIDGIELDFMRFVVYFPHGKGREYLAVMTDFMQKARAIVDEVGKKRGRPILLAVRVPARFDLCLEKGLDVPAWERKQLIDMISVSSHWLGDPALPVGEFKQKLGPTTIPVYASLETGQYNPYQFRSHGMYRAVAARCLQNGADGIYVFNFFFKSYLEKRADCSDQQGQVVCAEKAPELLAELANSPSLRGRNKLYSLSDGMTEYGYQPNTPLPVLVSPWDQVRFDFELAEDVGQLKPKNAYLFLRFDRSEKVQIFFNGQATLAADTTLIEAFKRDVNLRDSEYVEVKSVPLDALQDGPNQIAIRSSSSTPLLLKRAEMAVVYGEVETHGYF